jgi:predicted GNAT superfamily acetyltransferase
MQGHDPALALEWRLSIRTIFLGYFDRGYRAVDFFLSRKSGRGQYLLAVKAAEAAPAASG